MSINILFKKIRFNIERKFFSWRVILKKNHDFKNGKIIPLNEYGQDRQIIECRKRVICIYDNRISSNGLADRLRGIVSTYEVCKQMGLDFKLIFNSPFELNLFLMPNEVNWQISEEELNYNTNITDICYINSFKGNVAEGERQRKWFEEEFKKPYREFHVRTNAHFSYTGNFSELFHELFKFSPRLQTTINRTKAELGDLYVSTSFRFMNMLGDFNETAGIDAKLSNQEKETLISSCIEQIALLHKRHPEQRILVNSDSKTFLQRVSEIKYVYVNAGNITHVDAKDTDNGYETHEKTFVDFFMIANAEKIYLLQTGKMWNSGYPYAASKVYNKEFERIVF